MVSFAAFKKHKKELILGILLLGLFFFTRLWNLSSFPIFTDEAIYIYWAKVIATTHSQIFISLTDGKPPLLVWLIAIFLKLFPGDWYLFSGRLVSVLSGAGTLIGVYFLTKLMFSSKKAACIASFLYITAPFTLFYDRLALFDSLLSAMLIWSVFFAIRTGMFLKFSDAIFWGIFLGLAFLAKPPALIFWFLTPICAFLYVRNNKKKDLKKFGILTFIALLISGVANNILRISSAYSAMVLKNQQFQRSFSEIVQNPFEGIFENTLLLFSWMNTYLTFPLFTVCFLALIFLLYKKPKQGVILILLSIIPILVFGMVGQQFFPRYILFSVPYILIALSYGIFVLLKNKKSIQIGVILGVATLLILPIRFDYNILKDPSLASLPQTDYHQYISDHPSGYGLDNIYAFLDTELEKGNISLVTDGTFGLFPYAFNLRYWDNPNIRIIPMYPIEITSELQNEKQKSKVFIVIKDSTSVVNLPIEKIFTSDRPGGKSSILFAKLP